MSAPTEEKVKDVEAENSPPADEAEKPKAAAKVILGNCVGSKVCGLVELKDYEFEQMKNGKWRVKGKCSKCGRNISKFIAGKDRE